MGKFTSYAAKTTTASADTVLIVDSVTNSNKKVTLGNLIPDGAVDTTELADNSVTVDKIPDGTITNAKLDTTAGELGGAWQDWTPSYNNLSVGNGTVVARYRQIGKTVDFKFALNFGSTSSISGVPSISLPVTANYDVAQNYILGPGLVVDSGTANWFATCVFKSSTTFGLFVANGHGDTRAVDVSATKPMTWTTTDKMWLRGTYEAS